MMRYEVIEAAVRGDPIAMGEVLSYFNGYIEQLCTQAYVDEYGHRSRGVDTIAKTELQGKLMAAVMRFRL